MTTSLNVQTNSSLKSLRTMPRNAHCLYFASVTLRRASLFAGTLPCRCRWATARSRHIVVFARSSEMRVTLLPLLPPSETPHSPFGRIPRFLRLRQSIRLRFILQFCICIHLRVLYTSVILNITVSGISFVRNHPVLVSRLIKQRYTLIQ